MKIFKNIYLISILIFHLEMVLQADELSEKLVKASNVKAGLCVHIGVTDGSFTKDFGKSGSFLVHGLISNDIDLEIARKNIREAGIYGRVSVESADFSSLPYADNLINLLVVSDAKLILEDKLKLEEVLRVLSPMGVACLQGWVSTDAKGYIVKETIDGWSLITKPMPVGSSEWTHHGVNPSGNRVSEDTLAGPPHRLRWISGVEWAMPDYDAKSMVVGGGRVYYAINECPDRKGSWPYLSVRDAFSGLLLWKIPGAPNRMTMIADGDKFYMNGTENLIVVDGATGKELKNYDQAPKPNWALLQGNRLLVSCSATSELRCVDALTGALIWKNATKSFEAASTIINVAIQEGNIYYALRRSPGIGCLDFETGKEKWHRDIAADIKGEKGTVLVACQKDVMVLSNGKENIGFSTKDGSLLWNHSHEILGSATRRKAKSLNDGFFVDGLYWVNVGDIDSSLPPNRIYQMNRKYSWQGLDPLSGKVIRKIAYPEGYSPGASCFPDQSTVKYFMGGYSDFVDVKTGVYLPRSEGLHTSCGIGLRVAYGLIYNSALYMPGRFLQGDMAVEMNFEEKIIKPDDPTRLEKGSAFELSRNVKSEKSNTDEWPVYRNNNLRTSRSDSKIATTFTELFAVDCGAEPSAPTIAGGKVFVASAKEFRVSAFDVSSGKLLWFYTVGGSVKVPPTIDKGLCFFGSSDGYVYCLDAANGKLVWRFLAARTNRRIVAHEKIESTWPVEEGVVVQDGLVSFAAGRHGEVDNGIDLYVLEGNTGKFIWHKAVDNCGYLSLILTSEKTLSFKPKIRFDLKTGSEASKLVDSDSPYNRLAISPTYIMGKPVDLPVRLRGMIKAGEVICAVGRTNEGAIGDLSIKFLDQVKSEPAGHSNFPEVHPLDSSTPQPKDWKLWSFSSVDGKKLSEITIPARPAWDSMAVASGRLFLTTEDGKLRCFGEKSTK